MGSVDVVSGCSFKEIYRFPHITLISLLLLQLLFFDNTVPTFCSLCENITTCLWHSDL